MWLVYTNALMALNTRRRKSVTSTTTGSYSVWSRAHPQGGWHADVRGRPRQSSTDVRSGWPACLACSYRPSREQQRRRRDIRAIECLGKDDVVSFEMPATGADQQWLAGYHFEVRVRITPAGTP